MITYVNIHRLITEGKLQIRDDGKWYDMSFDGKCRVPTNKDRRLDHFIYMNGMCCNSIPPDSFDRDGVLREDCIRIKPGVL